MRKLNQNRRWYTALLCIGAVVLLLPLLYPGMSVSDDGNWMVIRLSAFFQSLREGQFPVRFLGRLNNSYGYPVANFLYPGFLYLGSFIHILGFSFQNSVKLIIALSAIGSVICFYAWLRTRFSQISASIGAMSFLLSPYLVFDIYRRGSVGEVFAFFPIALALYSLSKNIPKLFPLALGILLIAHNSLALLFFVFLVFYALFLRRKNFVFPFFLGIGLAAFFWFPALYERKYVLFDFMRISDPSQYFISLNRITSVGFVQVIAFFYLLLLRRYSVDKSARFFLMVFAGSLFLATPASRILWESSSLEKLFQFPFRFLSLTTFAGGWLVAHVIEALPKKRQHVWTAIGMTALLLFALPVLLRVSYEKFEEGYYTTNEATTTVANEYMPRWVKILPTSHINVKMEFFKGRGTFNSRVLTTQRIDADIHALEESVIQINTIYYPGWGVAIDGQPAVIDYQNSLGVMRVSVPQGRHRIIAEFRETFLRFLSDCVTLASIIIYGLYVAGIRKFWIRRARKT